MMFASPSDVRSNVCSPVVAFIQDERRPTLQVSPRPSGPYLRHTVAPEARKSVCYPSTSFGNRRTSSSPVALMVGRRRLQRQEEEEEARSWAERYTTPLESGGSISSSVRDPLTVEGRPIPSLFRVVAAAPTTRPRRVVVDEEEGSRGRPRRRRRRRRRRAAVVVAVVCQSMPQEERQRIGTATEEAEEEEEVGREWEEVWC